MGGQQARHGSKRVLVVLYSQSGQLQAVAEQMLAPLRAAPGITLHVETLQPRPAYPFPWPVLRFLDAFPETVALQPPPLAPLALSGDEDFDLVILLYTVWYLAPSPPVTAFLQQPLAQQLLRGKPVVTVIACRNMWMRAQQTMASLLAGCGARLVDNVVLTDPGPVLATFITTPRWLWTGRQGGFWGLPAAGLGAAQIAATQRFGAALREALEQGAERGDGPLLAGLGAVVAEPRLYFSEQAGWRSFRLWGRLLRAAGGPGAPQRVPLLLLYVAFLAAAIVTVVPASLALQALLRPLLAGRLGRIKRHNEKPSGSGKGRLSPYAD